MKILILTARYLPHRGGLESVVQHLAQEFSKQGHQVQIVTNRYPRSLPAVEIIDGVKVTRLHFILPNVSHLKKLRIDLWLAGLWYSIFTIHALKKIVQGYQPDIVNTHYLNEVAEFTGRCLSRYFNQLPWVISLHGGDVDGEPFLSKTNKLRFHTLTHQAHRLTACSRFLAKQAQALDANLSNSIEVIHNGVDVKRFSSAQPPHSDVPYILAVGQLVLHKGFDLLIRAFEPLVDKHPLVELWIAGDGSHRNTLDALVAGKVLEQRVRFLGKVDEAMVASLMKGALFIAMPSLKEPFGIVALEAMACGKVVMATPVGGIPEFLPCPLNRMVNPKQSDWTTALDEWLSLTSINPIRSDENLASARQLDWSLVSERYLQVYGQALIRE